MSSDTVWLPTLARREFEQAYPRKVVIDADGPDGDKLLLYWRDKGQIAPFRVGGGHFYLLDKTDPALSALK